MKCTSPTSRTIDRVAKHLKNHPEVIRIATLIRIKAINFQKLLDNGKLKECLETAARAINLPKRLQKNLTRLAELLSIAGRCIENALALKASSFEMNSLVMLKKSAEEGWFKIIDILPDWQLVLQSVSGQKRERVCSAGSLELVTL